MPEEICPLLSSSEQKIPCLKNDCKWFYQSTGRQEGMGICAIQQLNFELSQLGRELDFIKRKLPSELSFKK